MKKIIARIILGIGVILIGYIWLEEPAQKFGWDIVILAGIIVISGTILFAKVFWTLLNWAFGEI